MASQGSLTLSVLLNSENKMMRRVQGMHDIRLDGMTDILMRAPGASVLDLGCNRGRVSDEFARNGAWLVHGCDIDPVCVEVCRHLLCDLRMVTSKFEVVDLTGGGAAMTAAFGKQKYDIIVMLATYHKIKRKMAEHDLTALITHLGERCEKFFCWRGTSDKPHENEQEMRSLDRDLGASGLKRIHTSHISLQLGVCAIWARR